MKIVNKSLDKTADISSAKGTAFSEFWKLVLAAIVLLAGVFIGLGPVVDLAVTKIPARTEAKWFKTIQIPAKSPKESKYRERLENAGSILKQLAKNPRVPPLPYRVVLMKNEDPNAFAFPGGTIGLTTGLLDNLAEEIAIAFVIGHELGHFHHRDHLKGMGRAIGYTVLTAAIFSGSIGADSFGSIINLVLQRRYSQDREKKADRFGLELVNSEYGRTKGTRRLFEVLRESENMPQWAYMFATHPSPAERIQSLERYAKKLP